MLPPPIILGTSAGPADGGGEGCRMRREWEPEDLLACWTLMDPDRQLLANKAGATRLGFAVLLKFFELEARFPRHGGEVPPVAVAYLAQQVGVEAAEFTRYGWSGRAVKYHSADPAGVGLPGVDCGRRGPVGGMAGRRGVPGGVAGGGP